MKVKDLMSKKLITISPEENAAVAARLLSRYNIGALPVCSGDGKLRGMVTDRDIVLRCVAADEAPERTKISEIMTRRVITVDEEVGVEAASALMAREQIRRLPVQRQGHLVGMVALADLCDKSCDAAENGETLRAISQGVRVM